MPVGLSCAAVIFIASVIMAVVMWRMATRRAVRILQEEFLKQRHAELHSPSSILMLNRVESRLLRGKEWPETWEAFVEARRKADGIRSGEAKLAYWRCRGVLNQLEQLCKHADEEHRATNGMQPLGMCEAYYIAFLRLERALEVEEKKEVE
jgi:hypothetical protein